MSRLAAIVWVFFGFLLPSVLASPPEERVCDTTLSPAMILDLLSQQPEGQLNGIKKAMSELVNNVVVPSVQQGCAFACLRSEVASPSNFRTTAALPGSPPLPRVAISVPQDSVTILQGNLEQWGAHLLTHWFYAESLGYDLFLYVHQERMPVDVPGHFTKIPAIYGVLFGMGYDYALHIDWDAFIDPMAAIPITHFAAQWPNASILVQAEPKICNAVVIYKQSNATQDFLEAWWQEGLTGEYNSFIRDQAAFKQVLQTYLVQVTRSGFFYPEGPKEFHEPPGPQFNAFFKFESVLRERSAIGFVGLDKPHNTMRVSLHSCLGQWAGCIPEGAPVLAQHSGHIARTRVYKHALLRAIWSWHRILMAKHGVDQRIGEVRHHAFPSLHACKSCTPCSYYCCSFASLSGVFQDTRATEQPALSCVRANRTNAFASPKSDVQVHPIFKIAQ